jgi:hypothetical protein
VKRLALCLCAELCLAVGSIAPAAAAAPSVVGHPEAVAKYVSLPPNGVDFARLPFDMAAGTTLPMWSSSIASGGTTYNYTMLGTSPFAAPKTTTIPIKLYAVKFTFANGAVFDAARPACGDTESVVQRTLNSPVFQKSAIVSNGVKVGTTEYVDAFQRASFWSAVKGSPYHLLLNVPRSGIQSISVNVPSSYGTVVKDNACGKRFGIVNSVWFATAVLLGLSSQWKSTELTMVYMYDVFQSADGKLDQCCVLGYHAAIGSPPRVFGTATYNDSGVFTGPIEDVAALTHELGEATDDPLGANGTPAWGHVGQVSGCQSNLEVGDPLTDTLFGPITLGGFTYHPQELAFFSWFYRQTPSLGTGGLYSLGGTFKAPQGACH